jgi:hypothetical protein
MKHGANYLSCIHDYIYSCTEEEEEEEIVTFYRYITSHMKKYHEEKKAIPLVQLITLHIIRKTQ